jgi:uncharacterized membrane protein HdeD (DUF308 family)
VKLTLIRNWWSLVIRGVLGVLLGILTFLWPGITLAGLVTLFGAYCLIDGLLAIVGAVRAAQSHERWGPLVIEGLCGIAAAAVAFFWPGAITLTLIYLIGIWAIFTGVFEIVAAIRLRRHISGEWLLGLSGIASIVFGCLIMAVPLAGALVIALWFGAYVFIFGVLMIALGIRLRSMRHSNLAGPAIPAAT